MDTTNSVCVKLLDYSGNRTFTEIKDFDTVERCSIEVVSGDEILHIFYKDGYESVVDPMEFGRFENIFDFEYDIYDSESKDNLINDERFVNRTSAYDIER